MKNFLYLIGLLALICAMPFQSNASSHREAPLISTDPLADNTDVYAFKSPMNKENIVLVANYIPFEHPAGGPNWYSFGENIRYEIHVDNNAGTTGADIVYRFTFKKVNEDPSTFFLIRLGKENLKTTYTCERSTDGGQSFTTIISDGTVPPPHIGPRSIKEATGLNTTYEALVTKSIMTASSGEKIFCGPVDDPFFVDLGGIFDLGNIRKSGGRDAVAKFNCHSIVIEVPVATLQKGHKTVAQASNILDPEYVIGVYASSSRKKITTLYGGGDVGYDGDWVQVSRLGMPLTNEAIIPIGMKDRWNATSPANDLQFAKYFTNPELALYMDDSQFGTAVPGLADLRIQTKSLGSFDFRNGKPGLFGLKGNPALDGTALAEAAFGSVLLPDAMSPRAVDILPIFYTGVPNLPPYQLATGKNGNPLAAGKPFIHNFLPTLGDWLRLNMAVPATPRTDPAFSSLGLVQAAALGLTDAKYNKTTDLQWIPNMDGFPNGRRLEDDVTTIELQAVGGVVLAAIGLWYDDYVVGGNPVTPNLGRVLSFNAGVTKNDTTLKTTFPYLQNPWPGFRGPGYEGTNPSEMQPFAVAITNFNCTTGAFTFSSMGADAGKTVEYSAAGVVNGVWGTSVDRMVESELFMDENSSGVLVAKARYVNDPSSEVTMEYDFRAGCGMNMRQGIAGAEGTAVPLSAVVMGNPSSNDEVTIEIRGAAGKQVQLDLANSRGQVLRQQVISKATAGERRSVKLGGQAGIYYLRVTTPDDKYTVKILRR
ncbi:hypothetical protein DYBT9623_00711 [Dyadobacter sp. CECT 9623]|uniref:DUF4331 domain-containing protein n=1 Tax=Dyadobacter linearis TaxID=2823330 RepID=A0ABM8UKI4_9BACT|nr:DUF4331 family protein [Dyadobacter sp. CECT 9623]CAG5067983.1 hypothetical protein DYBT9623_00711 [Dyadobacter sp. CECT 9623]